jgi:hypothetical protein
MFQNLLQHRFDAGAFVAVRRRKVGQILSRALGRREQHPASVVVIVATDDETRLAEAVRQFDRRFCGGVSRFAIRSAGSWSSARTPPDWVSFGTGISFDSVSHNRAPRSAGRFDIFISYYDISAGVLPDLSFEERGFPG